MESMNSIPLGLQALLSASESLGISMTAPGPQGEQPTVASQILQQAASPQMPSIKQQAGIGAQIQAQQQAQKQRAAQDPNEVARRVAMMMQQGGVGALPVPAQFADGGIIGYSDEEEDLIDLLSGDVPTDYTGMGAFYQATEAPPEPPPIPRFERVQAMTPEELDEYRRSGTEPPADVIRERLATRQRAEQAAQAAQTAQQQAPRQVEEELYGPPVGTFGRRQPPSSAGVGYEVIAAPAAPEKPPQVPLGQSPTRPTMAEVTQAIGPLGDFERIQDRLRENARQRESFLTQQEGLESKGIAALEKALQEREAMVAEQRKWDSFDRLRAWFRDLGTRGNSLEVVSNGIKVRDEQMIQARLNTENAKIAQQRAQQEREAQRFDRADALEQAFFKMENEASKNHIYAAQVAANLTGSIYNTELKAYNDRLLSNANMLVEMAKVREQAEVNRQYRLSAAVSSLQGRLNQAINIVNEAVKDRYGDVLKVAELATAGSGKPDPKIQEALRNAAAFRKQQEDAVGIPDIRRQLQVLEASQAGMRVRQFDSQGNPVGASR